MPGLIRNAHQAVQAQQLVALGAYSHEALRTLVADTGIVYDRLERGILHFLDRKSVV